MLGILFRLGRKIIFRKYFMYFLVFSATENIGQQKLFFNLTEKTSLIFFEKWITGFYFLNLNFSFWHACLWKFDTANYWSLLVTWIYRWRFLNFRIQSPESCSISQISINVARIWQILPESGMLDFYETGPNPAGLSKISSLVIFKGSRVTIPPQPLLKYTECTSPSSSTASRACWWQRHRSNETQGCHWNSTQKKQSLRYLFAYPSGKISLFISVLTRQSCKILWSNGLFDSVIFLKYIDILWGWEWIPAKTSRERNTHWATPPWADSNGGTRWNRWGWFNLQ